MSPVPDLKFKVVSELLPGLCRQVLQVSPLCLEFFGLDVSANISDISVDLFQGCHQNVVIVFKIFTQNIPFCVLNVTPCSFLTPRRSKNMFVCIFLWRHESSYSMERIPLCLIEGVALWSGPELLVSVPDLRVIQLILCLIIEQIKETRVFAV